MEHTNNSITIRGSLQELPRFSHENHGRNFYRFLLEVPRLSGAIDILPVIAEESILSSIVGNESVSVTGGTIKATSFYVDEEEEKGGAIFGGEEGNVVTFGSGLKITASTEPDGTPGPYNVSNHVLYDLIIVTPVGSGSYLAGDLNEDGFVKSDDAIYLLYYTLFGEARYPINQPIDFDKNEVVNSADAIYLLYHTLFGSGRYPL